MLKYTKVFIIKIVTNMEEKKLNVKYWCLLIWYNDLVQPLSHYFNQLIAGSHSKQ